MILLLFVSAIIGGYLLGISVLSLIYGVDLTDYKKAQGIPLANTVPKMKNSAVLKSLSSPDIDTYMAMSKEELINELIVAKANELRAKKGYEVKGAGANKEYSILNNKNTKS